MNRNRYGNYSHSELRFPFKVKVPGALTEYEVSE